MNSFVEEVEDNSVIIDIYENNSEDLHYDNLETFGAELLGYGRQKKVKLFQKPPKVAQDFKEYSFDHMLKHFDRGQLDSIHFFAVHHNIEVKEAIRYKLVCHCCGNKLNEFGTDICSIRCADFLFRNKNKCIHGANCVFCCKESMMLINNESTTKGRQMTNEVLGICSELDLEKGENGKLWV